MKLFEHFKGFFFLLFFFLPEFSDSNSIEPLELKKEKECIDKQLRDIVTSNTKKSILCELGETCILKSHYCGSSSKWRRHTTSQAYYSHEIDFSSQSSKFFLNSYNELVIRNVRKADAGIYEEVLYGKTSIREYHVTVLDELIYYPIFQKSINDASILTIYSDQEKLNKKLSKRYSNICVNVSYDDAWSECYPLGNNTKKMYQFITASCFFTCKSKIWSGENKLENYLFTLISLYSNRILCESSLIPLEFKISIRSIRLRSYKIYRECSESSSENKHLNNSVKAQRYNFLYNLPESSLVIIEENKNLRLKCNIEFSCLNLSQLELFWKYRDQKVSNFSYEGRIFMDHLFRLNINRVVKADATNYTCYLHNEVKRVYVIRVITNYNSTVNLLANIGIYLFIFTLTTTLVLSSKKSKVKI